MRRRDRTGTGRESPARSRRPLARAPRNILLSVDMDDDNTGRIASAGSFLSGIIFATGWYLFWGTLLRARTECIVWNTETANCTAVDLPPPTHAENRPIAPDGLVGGAYWAPGILSTFGLIGLNIVSWEAVSDEGSLGEGVSLFAKIWVTASLIFMFTGLGVSIWCLVTDLQAGPDYWHWGGINTFLQNLLLLSSGFLFRLVRRSGEHSI